MIIGIKKKTIFEWPAFFLIYSLLRLCDFCTNATCVIQACRALRMRVDRSSVEYFIFPLGCYQIRNEMVKSIASTESECYIRSFDS